MRNNIGKSHYEQMLRYAMDRENTGWYYGSKHQFEKRHKQIVLFLQEAIEKIEAKENRK